MTPDAAAVAVTTRPARGAGGSRLRVVQWPTLVYVLTIALAAWAVILDETQRINFGPSLLSGTDVANYWGAWLGGLYHGSRLIYGTGVYLYSPAFAELLGPLTALAWPVFRLVWLLATLATFGWLIRPARGPDRMLLIPIAIVVSIVGGIEWLYCLVLVFGCRRPALWAIPLLTKVTPGVGILWFAARREWGKLAIAIAVTAGVALASFLIAPSLWLDWIDLLYRNVTVPHYDGAVGLLPVRVVLAAVIVWVGARRDRPEALILAMVLAAPDVNWTVAGFALALPRIGGAFADAARPRGSDRLAEGPVETRGSDRHRMRRGRAVLVKVEQLLTHAVAGADE